MTKCSYCEYEITCEHCIKMLEKPTCNYCTELLQEGAEESQLAELAKKERELEKYYKCAEMLENYSAEQFQNLRMIKEELKEMSKREIEKAAFENGVSSTIQMLLRNSNPEMLKEAATNILEKLNSEREKKNEKPLDFDDFIISAKDIAEVVRNRKFGGSWEKMIKWTEIYGSEDQKKEIPLLKGWMEKENTK